MSLAIPHEAAFLAKGYTRVKPKKELSRWGSPLLASTAASSKPNKSAGEILLSLLHSKLTSGTVLIP